MAQHDFWFDWRLGYHAILLHNSHGSEAPRTGLTDAGFRFHSLPFSCEFSGYVRRTSANANKLHGSGERCKSATSFPYSSFRSSQNVRFNQEGKRRSAMNLDQCVKRSRWHVGDNPVGDPVDLSPAMSFSQR